MATRSNIGYLLPNGEVRSIYCHWDGYVSHNGKILQEFYSSSERVSELVALGNLSVLDVRISPTQPGHSFSSPEKGICVYYGRDRGDPGQEPRDLPLEDFREEEYAYLWDGSQWLVESWEWDGQKPLVELL